MAERGRQPGFVMGPEHRLKIANSNILRNLIKAADGEVELSQQQERISLALLKKVMPDLQAMTISGDPDAPLQHEHTVKGPEKLAAYLDTITRRAAGEPAGE
jgi:hypothetical protein